MKSRSGQNPDWHRTQKRQIKGHTDAVRKRVRACMNAFPSARTMLVRVFVRASLMMDDDSEVVINYVTA